MGQSKTRAIPWRAVRRTVRASGRERDTLYSLGGGGGASKHSARITPHKSSLACARAPIRIPIASSSSNLSVDPKPNPSPNPDPNPSLDLTTYKTQQLSARARAPLEWAKHTEEPNTRRSSPSLPNLFPQLTRSLSLTRALSRSLADTFQSRPPLRAARRRSTAAATPVR